MKVVFDTNVVLDAMLERTNFGTAQELVMAVASDKIEGIVTANSITDIYYLSRRLADDLTAREVVTNTLTVFDITPVDGEICETALNIPMADYEDAVLAICAAKEKADYIVTSDQGFLKAKSPVRTISPAKLLEII